MHDTHTHTKNKQNELLLLRLLPFSVLVSSRYCFRLSQRTAATEFNKCNDEKSHKKNESKRLHKQRKPIQITIQFLKSEKRTNEKMNPSRAPKCSCYLKCSVLWVFDFRTRKKKIENGKPIKFHSDAELHHVTVSINWKLFSFTWYEWK